MAFANAKVLTTTPKTSKSKAREIELTGLEAYAAICAHMKSLETIKKTMEADIKEQMSDHFVEQGMQRKAQPDNFTGTEGQATASCQLRKVSSASALSIEAQTLLKEHGIPTEVSEQIPETFVINPSYLNDQAMLAKVEKAMGRVAGLPSDFIMKQEGRSKVVVSEKAIDTLFATITDEAVIAELLPVVSTAAIRPSLKTEDAGAVLEIIRKLVNPTHEEKAAEVKAAFDGAKKRGKKAA